MEAVYKDADKSVVTITLDVGDELLYMTGPTTFDTLPIPGLLLWDAYLDAGHTLDDVEQAVPNVVTDRQFIQALAEQPYTIITWSEAHAWGARGELPAILTVKLDAISDDLVRDRGYMLLMSAKTYELNHPFTQTLAVAMGWSMEDLKQLWAFASTL